MGLYSGNYHYTNQVNTTVDAIGVKINQSGENSTGVMAAAANSIVDIYGMTLTSTGDKSTGLWAKELGSEINARGVMAEISGTRSLGMNVENGATAYLEGSRLFLTGSDSHGVNFNFRGGESAMTIKDSYIEAQDGYAVRNQNGNLDLNVQGTTLVGGRDNVAIYIADNSTNSISDQSTLDIREGVPLTAISSFRLCSPEVRRKPNWA